MTREEVLLHAVDTFGNEERANRWLNEEIPALRLRTPISLLDSEDGRQQVDAVLTRIDYGVIS